MQVIAFDTETKAFEPGCHAPEMACMTWQDAVMPEPAILHGRFDEPRMRDMFGGWLEDPEVLLVGQHVSFDMAVCGAKWPELVQPIFLAYAANRIVCTKLRMQLFDIATGQFRGFRDDRGVWQKHTYDLGMMARRLLGKRLVKDGWRRRYGEFLDTPLSGWIELAEVKRQEAQAILATGQKDKDLIAIVEGSAQQVIQYPLDDASTTLEVFFAQEKLARDSGEEGIFADQFRQARAAWWLSLSSGWGMRTHAAGVAELRRATEAHVASLEGELVEAGLVRKNGVRDMKAAKERMLAACAANGVEPRATANNGVCLDRDACKASGDPIMMSYGELAQFKSVLSKDVPMLEAGTSKPIHTNYGLAETGRGTSSGPNLQNMRRLPGIREAFRPRDGWVYAQADYPQLELRTLGQACLDLVGHSELAKMLNAGRDPHLAFAASLLGITYEEAFRRRKDKDVDDARQIGKAFNFGKPGGLGAAKLVLFARKTYGVHLEEAEVRALSRTWLETFPEMREYFDHVNALTSQSPEQLANIVQLRSGRMRGGVHYTAACNSYFQGLGADATKHAGFAVSHGCYADPDSPLFGSRIVLFVHDEFIVEVKDDEHAHDAAVELSRVMRAAANEWVPDVPFSAPDPEPLLMRIWSKKAEAVYDANKRLVPWEPKAEKQAA